MDGVASVGGHAGNGHVTATPAAPGETLQFDNGWGGFSADGREYVIRLTPERGRLAGPPVPWINVIANPGFGTIVSETGAGYTWSGNSQRRRLTPWHNDPLLDPCGEALYLRDLDSGECWSPLPGPAATSSPHEVRHGFGYTRFRHERDGLEHDTLVFVAADEPVKVTHVRIANRSTQARRLALVSYQQLVLGVRPGPRRGRS
jgi:cyclic beta-1,2-glucan synthetase